MKELSKEIAKLFGGILILYIGYSMSRGFDEYYRNLIWWMLCGFPYGITRMRTLIIGRGGDGTAALMSLLFNFMMAGILGGFILAFRSIKTLHRILRISIVLVLNTSKKNEDYRFEQ